jgi:hypothetical protein
LRPLVKHEDLPHWWAGNGVRVRTIGSSCSSARIRDWVRGSGGRCVEIKQRQQGLGLGLLESRWC